MKYTINNLQIIKTSVFLLMVTCFYGCKTNKQAIDFVTLQPTEFNSQSLAIPEGKIIDSIKQAHDSCMGFSFNANAVLVKTKDSFAIGSILNKQTLKVVNTLQDLAMKQNEITSKFNFLTSPCYEKHVLRIPLKWILSDSFIVQLPGASDAENKELNADLFAAEGFEIQTGSWLYLDMKDALKALLDSAGSPASASYKSHLLDTANMVLTAVEGITDVSFIVAARKNISPSLLAILKTKPVIPMSNGHLSIRLSYIDDSQFELSLNGLFPMIGEFSKAQMK